MINAYKSLENRVISAFDIIPPSSDNKSCWSPEFRSILIDITEQIESIMKGLFYPQFCGGKWPKEYKPPIHKKDSNKDIQDHLLLLDYFVNLSEVTYSHWRWWSLEHIYPFDKGHKTPFWWTAAQKLKHNYYQPIDTELEKKVAMNISAYSPKKEIKQIRELANWYITLEGLAGFHTLIWILYALSMRYQLAKSGAIPKNIASHDPIDNKIFGNKINFRQIRCDNVHQCERWIPHNKYETLVTGIIASSFDPKVHEPPIKG
jgi:hypothetical protein